jgi:1,4-dihydroxy-2-naphthoate octaprenyltransferase
MDQSLEWSRRELWVRKLLYPGHTLPTAAAPAVVAAGLAFHNHVFAATPLFFAFLAGWLIQLGGVLTDNYENLVQQPEDREHPELVWGLKSGMLTLPGLRTAITTCYALALLAGIYLLGRAGSAVLIIGILSIGASWIYSAGPYPAGRHGLADPLFFLFFGVVSVVGCYYVQAAPTYGASMTSAPLRDALPLAAFALGLPVGALTTNILIIDDIRDREFDAVKGKRTIAVRFGKQWSRVEFACLVLFSYAAPVVFWLKLGFGATVLLPLLTLSLALSLVRDVFRLDRHVDLLPTTPKAGRLLLVYSVLLGIGAAAS